MSVALKNKYVTTSQCLGELFVTRHSHQVSQNTVFMGAYDPHNLAAAFSAVPCRNAIRCWVM